MTAGDILTLNAGSSSLKFAAYDATPDLPLKLSGQIYGLNGVPRMRASTESIVLADEPWAGTGDLNAVLERLFGWLAAQRQADGSTERKARCSESGWSFLVTVFTFLLARLLTDVSVAPSVCDRRLPARQIS